MADVRCTVAAAGAVLHFQGAVCINRNLVGTLFRGGNGCEGSSRIIVTAAFTDERGAGFLAAVGVDRIRKLPWRYVASILGLEIAILDEIAAALAGG